MRHSEHQASWKSLVNWIGRLAFVLWLPALVGLVYLAFLDARPDSFIDSSGDSSERIIQGITCPSLMVKDKPSMVETQLQNGVLNSEPTAVFTIDAPNFDFVRGDKNVIIEGVSSSWFISPEWIVYPNQLGRQRITISATEDNGLSNSVTCEVTVITFLGLDLDKTYGAAILIMGVGIMLNVQAEIRKRRQDHHSREKAV